MDKGPRLTNLPHIFTLQGVQFYFVKSCMGMFWYTVRQLRQVWTECTKMKMNTLWLFVSVRSWKPKQNPWRCNMMITWLLFLPGRRMPGSSSILIRSDARRKRRRKGLRDFGARLMGFEMRCREWKGNLWEAIENRQEELEALGKSQARRR